MILAIDTSIGTAVAVVDLDGAPRAAADSPDARGHAEVIGDLIVRVLAEAGPGEIVAVAAGMGPGPFTGLRVGIAAARAFALGRGIPVIDVPSHDGAALARLTDDPSAPPVGGEAIAVVTDARRRELALSVYRIDQGMPVRLEGPRLVPRASDELVEPFGLPVAELAETTAISAVAVGRLAAAHLRSGRPPAPASEPLYLRAPDVTLPAARKRVGT